MIEDQKDKKQDLKDVGLYYFAGAFTTENVKPCIEWILQENINKKHDALTLLISSTGGYCLDCFALIDIMQGSLIPINTVGLGVVASCGLITFIHGKNRVLTPNTYIISHQYSSGVYGKYHELVNDRKSQDWFHDRIRDIYIDKTKLSKEDVDKYLLNTSDVHLTAEEALKFGICDEVKLNK